MPHPPFRSPHSWTSAGARWAAVAIALLTIVAYVQATKNAFIWDDDSYVTQNLTLRDAAGLVKIWTDPRATPQYYPVVHTTFWIEHHLWGDDPAGYHVVNILLHAASAGMLFFLLRRWKIPGGDAAAWLAAALFAVHPVQTESVAWITERKNVLSGLFYMLALWQATATWRLDDVKPGENLAAKEGGKRAAKSAADPAPKPVATFDLRAYGLLALFFVLALLSKSVTATLPAAVLLVVWWKRGKITLRDWLPALPLLAVGIAAGVFTAYLEHEHVGARGEGWDLNGLQRALIAGRAAWTYLGHILWPHPLIFFYPRWSVAGGVGWQIIFPLAAVAMLAALWFARKKIGRGPLAAALFFGGTLFPALGFLNVYPFRYSYVADHFQYLACIGVLVPAACGVIAGGRWAQAKLRSSGALPVMLVPAILLLACVALTFWESYKYRDELTLWTDTAEKNQTSWAVYSNLGMLQMRAGKLNEAERSLLTSVRLENKAAETRANLGAVYLLQQKLDKSEEMFRQSLQRNPRYEAALRGLGAVLVSQGRFAEAADYLAAACAAGPTHALNFGLLGVALGNMGRIDEAVAALETGMRLDPSDLEIRMNLGKLLYRSGQRDKGAAVLREAIHLRPELANEAIGFMQWVDGGGGASTAPKK